MKMKKLTVEFGIDNLSLKKRLYKNKKTTHVVLATLIWPRPLIKEKQFIQTIQVDKDGNMPDNLTWNQTILGKEPVQGPFAIKIAVFKNMSDKQQADFVRYLMAETAKETGDYIGGLIDIPLASDLIEIPFDYFAKKIGSLNDKTGIIGSSCINLELIPEQNDFTENCILTTPRDFYTTRTISRAGKRTRVRKKILEKGNAIGEICISLKIYD
jgi:hypothetical protein